MDDRRQAKRIVVAGAPCSGKSSYVRERLKRGDVVYDYDTMHQALSGQASHQHDQGVRPYVLAAREAVLGLLASQKDDTAWVITSSPRTAELKRLQDMLGAEVVLLSVDRDEAHQRCDGDNRPAQWHTYIDNWFEGTDIDQSEWARKAARSKRGGTMHYKGFPITGFKALTDEGEGVFEAIVAVFGNVDRLKEKIMPGAFAKSLGGWAEKGRPIPVIFAHQWANLDAHIGHTLQAEERDEGLYIKGQLNMEEQFARKVWRKMLDGLLADFSLAYTHGETAWVKGVRELRELDILEVGPTLVGVNPATHLIAMKDARQGFEMMQTMHDLAVELGAACSGHTGAGNGGSGDEGGGTSVDDKAVTSSAGNRRSTLAARVVLGEWVRDSD